MPLNSSGAISLGGATTGQSVNLELGFSGTAQISFNDAAVRTLTGTTAGTVLIMPTNFYGKSNSFPAGNISFASLQAIGQSLTASGTSTTVATTGGTITVNGVSLGSYDYAVQNGSTLSSFTNSTWFTATSDTRAALIGVKGNLTINAGVTFIPSNRKLFTFIYVNGNLTLNGSISMDGMGANHNGTGNSGGATTAGNILLASGTYSGVSNPQIPAAGGNGGPGASGGTAPSGSAGSNGASGGGGGGSGNGGFGGNGQPGTSFVGGSGGGGDRVGSLATPGTIRGGVGGNGASGGGLGSGGGGAGQPGGVQGQNGPFPGFPGGTGIGGVVIIMVTGTLSGTGAVSASGTAGGQGWNAGGGGSGGGSVTIFYGTDTSSITPTATGGSGGFSNAGGAPGGPGGNGTARKLSF